MENVKRLGTGYTVEQVDACKVILLLKVMENVKRLGAGYKVPSLTLSEWMHICKCWYRMDWMNCCTLPLVLLDGL